MGLKTLLHYIIVGKEVHLGSSTLNPKTTAQTQEGFRSIPHSWWALWPDGRSLMESFLTLLLFPNNCCTRFRVPIRFLRKPQSIPPGLRPLKEVAYMPETHTLSRTTTTTKLSSRIRFKDSCFTTCPRLLPVYIPYRRSYKDKKLLIFLTKTKMVDLQPLSFTTNTHHQDNREQ